MYLNYLFSGSIIIRCFLNENADVYVKRTLEFVSTTLFQLSLTPLLISYMVFNSNSKTYFMHRLPQTLGNGLLLIQVRFDNDWNALRFKNAFNYTIIQNNLCFTRSPFAHFDQTRPERELRKMLNNFCLEKNSLGRGNFETCHRADAFELVSRVHYFHNGVQLFKVGFYF